ncbi:MAG: LysR family transcriptional regulator [Terrimicrobiaceae bacterium]|nr:LysR family transcriptional regulator [Terrimicrobiaceae bacterium]
MNFQINYHHLRYFHAVAAQGGIKAAARLLNLSAPTLSTQVHELEAFLGVQLFRRESRTMRLTEAGRVVQRYADRIFLLGDEMVEVVGRGGSPGLETVFLGIADSVPKLFASRLLSRAWQKQPSLRIVVREGLPGELFPALAAHQLDLVLSNEPAPSSFKTLLYSTRSGRFGVRWVSTPELRKAFRPRRGLVGFPVLVPARESPLRRELDRTWAERQVQPDVRAEFDDTAAMYELAAAGVGAAPVFDAVLPDVSSRYGLVELPCRTGIHEELFAVTAERQISSPGPRLITALAREMAE